MAPAYNFNLPTRADDPRNPRNFPFWKRALFAYGNVSLPALQQQYNTQYDDRLSRAMFARAQGGTAETAGTAQTFLPGAPKRTMQIEDFGPTRFGPAPEEPPLVRPTMRAGQEQESLIGTQVPIPMRRPYIPSDEEESALTSQERAMRQLTLIDDDPVLKAAEKTGGFLKNVGGNVVDFLQKGPPLGMGSAAAGRMGALQELMQENRPVDTSKFTEKIGEGTANVLNQIKSGDLSGAGITPLGQQPDPAIGIGADSPEVPMLAPPPGTEQIAVTAQRPLAIDAQRAPPMDVVPQGLEPPIGQAPSAMGTVVADQRDMAGIPTLAPVPMQRPEPLGPVPVFGDIEAASASVAAPGMQAEPEEIRRGRETVRQFNVNARKPTSNSAIKPINVDTLSFDALRVLSAMPEPMQRFIQGLPSREEEKRKQLAALGKIFGSADPKKEIARTLQNGEVGIESIGEVVDLLKSMDDLRGASDDLNARAMRAINIGFGGVTPQEQAEQAAQYLAEFRTAGEAFGLYDQIGETLGNFAQPFGLDVFLGQETRNATRKVRNLNNTLRGIGIEEIAGVGRVFAGFQENIEQILPVADAEGFFSTGDSEATALAAYTEIRDNLQREVVREAQNFTDNGNNYTKNAQQEVISEISKQAQTVMRLNAMIAGLERAKFFGSSDRTTTDPVDVPLTDVNPRELLTEYFFTQ